MLVTPNVQIWMACCALCTFIGIVMDVLRDLGDVPSYVIAIYEYRYLVLLPAAELVRRQC